MMMAKQGIGATKVASVVGGSMGKSGCTACHTVCFLLSTFSKSVDKTIIVSCLCSFSLRNYTITCSLCCKVIFFTLIFVTLFRFSTPLIWYFRDEYCSIAATAPMQTLHYRQHSICYYVNSTSRTSRSLHVFIFIFVFSVIRGHAGTWMGTTWW